MIRAQALAARAALTLTVLLAIWLIFTGLGSAGSENIRAAPIEDRGSPRAVKSGAADREGVDALQATAMVSAINVATPVSGPEPKLISAVLTEVATDDLALPKPATSIAEGSIASGHPQPARCPSKRRRPMKTPRNFGCPRECSRSRDPCRRTFFRRASAIGRNAQPRIAVHFRSAEADAACRAPR